MADDVKPEVIKKTQESLGKFIKKPVLTEKLLKKPPFRFLHDICTSVMKETGFFGNVLNSAEDKFENIKDKEGKIEFLQKVIAAVESANGIKLAVKPNKVVAGLEATKTNEFLQALGKAIEKQQADNKSSKVAQSSKSKTTKKPTKEVKEEPPDKKKTSNKTSKKILENGLHETNDKSKNREISHAPSSPKRKHSIKKAEEPEPKIEEENINHNGVTEEKPSIEKEEIILRQPDVSGAGESENVPEGDLIIANSIDAQGDHNTTEKQEIVYDGELKRGASGKHRHRRPSVHNPPESAKTTEPLETNENGKVTSPGEKTGSEKLNSFNRPDNILNDQNRGTPSPSGQLSYPKKDTSLVKEGTLISRPRTGIRPTTARPASARPAAPRIRDRGEITVAEEVIKPVSGKVQVIEEKDASNELEDENLISLETTNDILIEEPLPILPPTTTTNDQEHGHLVEQILEVQRELEDDSKFSEEKTSGKTEIEWESKKNRESTSREIEKLRANIQMLTRTANPLGKLLDFFQEDIDIVQRELESWKEKNSNLRLQIAHEKSITDQFVEPLKIHLKELQQNIDEQIEQINVVKANIIRNNQKIQKLLTGM